MLHNVGMNTEITNYRVARKLSPTARGAVKLARRHGESLVCVRHRVDPTGKFRITTVELVVEKAPIEAKPGQLVEVRIGYDERPLRAFAIAAGATWDKKSKIWCMPLRVARALNIQDRIIEK
jgi:hypothetical protein